MLAKLRAAQFFTGGFGFGSLGGFGFGSRGGFGFGSARFRFSRCFSSKSRLDFRQAVTEASQASTQSVEVRGSSVLKRFAFADSPEEWIATNGYRFSWSTWKTFNPT